MDSENYRLNSRWCKVEIDHFFNTKQKSPNKTLVVCLIQKNGEWRNIDKGFELINLHKYYDFSICGIYDNQRKYDQAINDVCKCLNANYTPWHKMPYEKDFEDELAQIRNNISDEDRKSLLSDYETIRLRSLQKHLNVDDRIRIWVEDCNRLKVKSIFPYLISGIRQAETEDWQNACKTFTEATRSFSNDPRAFRGLGSSLYYCGKYSEALVAYNTALSLIDSPDNKKHRECRKEILQNKAVVFQTLGEYQQALSAFALAYQLMKNEQALNPKIYLDIEFCYRQIGMTKERLKILREGISLFYGEPELHAQLGRFYYEQANYSEAIKHYQTACKYEASIRYFAALALIHAIMKNTNALQIVLNDSLILSPQNDEDYYYMGFIHYLVNDKMNSKKFFDHCQWEEKPLYDNIYTQF